MIKPHVFKGIEYIVLDELPAGLKQEILEIINDDLIIKIMIDNRVVSNCLLFDDYRNCVDVLSKRRLMKGSAA